VNLDGSNLSGMDLTGVNLTGTDLRNVDLTGAILEGSSIFKITINDPTNPDLLKLADIVNLAETSEGSQYLETKKGFLENIVVNGVGIQNINVTRYDLNGKNKYLATKEGYLFELINNTINLALNLNTDTQFPFDNSNEGGLLGLASNNDSVYISYTTKDSKGKRSLVVDEYSMNFKNVNNIIKIEGFNKTHFAGNLAFDSLGGLYLSVGDAHIDTNSQDLNSLKGKILRLDILNSGKAPEIIAYGIRNPWGLTIDEKNRMFILQCGDNSVEAVYLVNDLYSDIPVNLGWPVFEGSFRKKESLLSFNDVLTPIFEYKSNPGCVTAGVYLEDSKILLLGDFYGVIRALKEKENGEWYLFHEYNQNKTIIFGFGYDKETKKILVAPNNFELDILVNQLEIK
jgi:hypothetical protein